MAGEEKAVGSRRIKILDLYYCQVAAEKDDVGKLRTRLYRLESQLEKTSPLWLVTRFIRGVHGNYSSGVHQMYFKLASDGNRWYQVHEIYPHSMPCMHCPSKRPVNAIPLISRPRTCACST
jgi:hypothetical protein